MRSVFFFYGALVILNWSKLDPFVFQTASKFKIKDGNGYFLGIPYKKDIIRYKFQVPQCISDEKNYIRLKNENTRK